MRRAPAWMWFLFLFLVAMTIAMLHDVWYTLDPHYGGTWDEYGHPRKFRDNGDRFISAVGPFVLALMSSYGAFRIVQMARKEIADRRWHWEVVVDEQVWERPPPDEDNIRQDMNGFDGKLAACDLRDNDTGSRVLCYGEPDRRVVDVHFVGGGMDGDYRLARRDCADTNVQMVQVGAARAVSVAAREVLTGAQALEIMLAFFAGRQFPLAYHWEPRPPSSGT
jgi:hypothetical protein